MVHVLTTILRTVPKTCVLYIFAFFNKQTHNSKIENVFERSAFDDEITTTTTKMGFPLSRGSAGTSGERRLSVYGGITETKRRGR